MTPNIISNSSIQLVALLLAEGPLPSQSESHLFFIASVHSARKIVLGQTPFTKTIINCFCCTNRLAMTPNIISNSPQSALLITWLCVFIKTSRIFMRLMWSGLRGSNPPPQPWQGCALPNELNPHMVPPVGIEPTTRGFSVPCSTN